MLLHLPDIAGAHRLHPEQPQATRRDLDDERIQTPDPGDRRRSCDARDAGRAARRRGPRSDSAPRASTWRSSASARRELDAVISDIRMPGRSGLEILGEVRELQPELPMIMMTAFGSIDSAVEAMQAGAFDYVTKPFKRDAILVPLERAFEKSALEAGEPPAATRRRSHHVVRRPHRRQRLHARDLRARSARWRGQRAHVLIPGESGTGKEIVARALHSPAAGPRSPSSPCNCTALPEGAARERALRPRARRVHRRRRPHASADSSSRPTAARSSSTRSAT